MKQIAATFGAMALIAAATMTGMAQAKEFKVALDGTFAPHAMPTADGGVEGAASAGGKRRSRNCRQRAVGIDGERGHRVRI